MRYDIRADFQESERVYGVDGGRGIPEPFGRISDVKGDKEYEYILSCAIVMREMEMTESFVKVMKYLLCRNDRISGESRSLLLENIAEALKISRDEELIRLLMGRFFDIFTDLPLPPSLKDEILGTICREIHDYSDGRYLAFDMRDDPVTGVSIAMESPSIMREMHPESLLMMCNLNSAKYGNDKERYHLFLNRYLAFWKLPEALSVELEDENILSSLSFDYRKYDGEYEDIAVSVIVSVYNSRDTVEYAVRSLLEQSHENLEILICDDASRDDSVERLMDISRLDGRIRLFRSIRNQGTYNIRNALIQRATGKYVTFHDSDDFSLPCRIEMQLRQMEEEGKTASFCRWVRIDEDGKFIFHHDGFASRFCVVSAMVPRTLFSRVPRFRETRVAGDTEFYKNIEYIFSREEISILSEPLIFGLHSENSLTLSGGIEARTSGYIASSRRLYSDISARQRVLGRSIVPDSEVEKVLKNGDIYMEPSEIEEYRGGRWI